MPAPDDETLDHLLDSPPESITSAEDPQTPGDPRVSVMDWLLGVGEAVARKVTAGPRSPAFAGSLHLGPRSPALHLGPRSPAFAGSLHLGRLQGR